MVTFNYKVTPPNNHQKLEADIREKYKDIFEKFPDAETIFTWTGEKWEIGSSIELGHFTFHESSSNNA